MTTALQAVITAARALSPRDKLELLRVISQELAQTHDFTEETARFWHPQSIAELVAAQNAPVITDIHALAVDFWPEDETADDINAFIAAQRQADRQRDA